MQASWSDGEAGDDPEEDRKERFVVQEPNLHDGNPGQGGDPGTASNILKYFE